MITRLLEEAGELAAEVNHAEGLGVKVEKHGAFERAKMAKEVQDVLRVVLQLCAYYDLEEELVVSVRDSLERMKNDGLV